MATNKNLNIGLLGYGRMGHEIEQKAMERGHQIAAVFEIDSPMHPGTDLQDIDVLIDFSVPDAVMDNIQNAAKTKTPIVIGVTGWTEKLQDARNIITNSDSAAIYAANFSLGINLFYRISRYAAEAIERFPEYDAYIHEMHHRGKIDSPSGTALHLGRLVCGALSRKKTIKTSRSDGQIENSALHISSTRSGQVPGTHILGLESAADSIELRHTARNRQGYAAGAVYAAEWLIDKTGFFSIEDLLDSVIKE
jgi:4-hydroxy-tetrahydrodipicolinate reductase